MTFRSRLTVLALLVVIISPQASSSSQTKDRAEPSGLIKVAYGPLNTFKYTELQMGLREDRLFESIAARLNDALRLPADLTVALGECGEAAVAYDRTARRVTICYEVMEKLARLLSKNETHSEIEETAVIGATAFVFYHSLAHALLDALELPAADGEEDAVDQLMAFLLKLGPEAGERAVIDGASWFILDDEEETNLITLGFWKDHSLSPRRVGDILCWIYGGGAAKHSYLAKYRILPTERAVSCSNEFSQVEARWSKALRPFMRKATGDKN
ncbi:MAG TPA: DUF4344 domain-containing metallopeptidase [Blastocatellia bacterium]|nr:DUF4344 domain-containing metallopeptidase [Blastocatellia bacterium]